MSRLYPANLNVSNRRVLMVGGGRVALRKIRRLLQAGAEVTIVAPTIHPQIVALRTDFPTLNCQLRPFLESDLDGVFMAFAATDNPMVNQAVTSLARSKNVLCSVVDAQWGQGDFISPAYVSAEGINLAVSTDGEACRRTKMIAATLGRRMASIGSAELLVLGTDQRFLDLSNREQFHFSAEKIQRLGQLLSRVWGLHEFVILNTCNRFEILAATGPETETVELMRTVAGLDTLDESQFYCKRGEAAFAHLCEVNAGLLSQTPGENHITAQLKEALDLAVNSGWADSMMTLWFERTRHISRQIRQEVAPILKAFEIEELALDFASRSLDGLAGKTVTVLGSGMVGNGLAELLLDAGAKVRQVYRNRQPQFAVEAFPMTELSDALTGADAVITALSADALVLTVEQGTYLAPHTVLVDLCVPRTIDPNLREHVGAFADMEDLKHWHRRYTCDRHLIDRLSANIIENHRAHYEKIIFTYQGRNQSQQSGGDSKS